ncbi:MAG: phosphoglucosamine mutase [Hadesarchaea archaeon]|nr:MAG: phosphoglucosamine mutase [Hadesarchaea archaeon]
MGKLFGTSGVRGVLWKQITPGLMMDLGLVFATHLGNSGTVVVGRDPRVSSVMLEDSFISGLLSGGCRVRQVGTVPTPVVGFAVRRLRAVAGVMVTASHNPPQYNGIKLFDSDGMAYTPELETKIEEAYFEKRMERVRWDRIGKVEKANILSSYVDEAAARVRLKRRYKIVVDCGNGSGSLVTPFLFRKLGCEVKTLNAHPDGTFPGRGLEPSAENLEGLCKAVKTVGADLGIAHDGDADRVAAVDDLGRVVQPDKLLALVAAGQLAENRKTVVTTVDSSMVVDEVVAEHGGKVVRTPVGDVHVAAAVKQHDSAFGGEPSGAWIFPDFHLAPDGPFGSIKILELMDSTGKKLSELLDGLPNYQTAREKIPCPNSKKIQVMEKVGLRSKEISDVLSVSHVDGTRLEFNDGWVLVRPSGTEPYIRVTAESKSSERASDLLRMMVKILGDILHTPR